MELPKHVAIIMDGNGRWAKERKRSRLEGHKEGIKAVKAVIEAAIQNNIPYLTLYAFSSENWNRPKEEVSGLMQILNQFIKNEAKTLDKYNIRLKTIGRIHELPKENYLALRELVESTADHDALTLTVALNYSSQNEIVDAVQSIVNQSLKQELDPQKIDYSTIAQNLETKDLPDPDLVIRTSGEYRLSNFLLLQSAYAEIYISPIYWPDFNQSHFETALNQFGQRDRRYGAIK